MVDVSPLPVADVDLSDIGAATLNLMDNAVLRETATAVSSIGICGSDVTVSVTTDFLQPSPGWSFATVIFSLESSSVHINSSCTMLARIS